jgi:glutamate dehydrogenase/leucine dehydrogenase
MAATGTGLFFPTAHAAVPALKLLGPSRTEYDVIVIGVGFAGVTAARELSRQGCRLLSLKRAIESVAAPLRRRFQATGWSLVAPGSIGSSRIYGPK